jgi:hypothetical protein
MSGTATSADPSDIDVISARTICAGGGAPEDAAVSLDAIRERFDPDGMGLFNLCWIIRRLYRCFVYGLELVAPILDAAELSQSA